MLFNKKEAQKSAKRAFRIVILGGVAVALIAAFVYGFLRWWEQPDVGLTIEGPAQVRAGDRILYEIIVENPGRSALEDASLIVRAGSGVILSDKQDLRILRLDFPDTLDAGAIRRERIEAYFLGKQGDTRELEISFSFRMPNIASPFAKTERITAKIAESAVSLNLNLPKQTLANNDFEFSYEWKNISGIAISHVTVELSYPENFIFTGAEPAPEDEKRWRFDELAAQETQSVSVSGRLDAAAGETRSVRASLFGRVRGEQILLGEMSADISVTENPIIIAMSVNGKMSYNANPGELLDYRITFKNNFSETLRDIVIVAKLSGEMIDVKSVSSDGAFDPRNMTVTFHGGNSPQLLFLDPRESGSVAFRAHLLESFLDGLKNPTVSASAEMTASVRARNAGIEEQMSAAASVEAKVNGIAMLSSQVLLRDANTDFAVIGPWPMVANQTTQMTVRWDVTALANDFENIIVSTTLPGGVSYLGNATGNISGTQVIANPRTSRIEWQIPRLTVYQSRDLAFQIGITPKAANIGAPVGVMSAVAIIATDVFTGNRSAFETPALKSDELTDPSVQRPDIEGRVR